MAIDLGPFKLLHPIGRGGMGVVWLGRHETQGVPVAVKVITAKVASTEEYHRAFEQEVRAVGALDHPGVVWIFDSGKISASVAAQSAGELVEGSPYLVMEYASHGTLRQWVRPLAWPEIRGILMSLLDALAHAHARGVLHRDLKPDNILIAGPDDLRPGFKITDFGIARPLDDTAIAEARPIGTPQYMAPEQIRNDTERYGPHTDLYAIGTLGWKLVTGKLPFHGMQGAPLMYAQLHKPPPKMVPQGDVPTGTERFLRTLLAKEPHERFQRAADAALALAELDQQEPELALTMPIPRLAPGLRLGEGGDGPDLELETATLKIVVTQRRKSPLSEGGPVQQPPFPATWRLPDTASRPLRLMGAGLGLFGLRPVPLVGRETERDLLWKAMREVHQEGRAQVVVVRGPAGVGRTRLLQWVSERAHEVGGATVLRTAFTAANTALEQIRRGLARLLQTNPLPPALRARFEEVLGPELAALPLEVGIARLLDPGWGPEHTPLAEPQRHAVLRRIWELLSLDRPLFVTFDDVQWAPEALKLARHLLDVQESRPCRVLIVATVLDDVLERHHSVTRCIEALSNRRSARIVQLKPFEGEQRVDLVHELLGLDIGLAEMVAERTDGNPLFATQLVGDWVNRGLLLSGPSGFVLANPDEPLPSSLAEVWDGRIRALAQGLEPPALELLERAAVLGRDVDVLEWQAVCDDPEGKHAATGRTYFNPRHARLRAALMERLLAQRLAQATERGFVFTHADFQKAVLARATNAGRLKRHATTAAAILQSGLFEEASSEADAERLARVLADSGQPVAAVDALLRAEQYRRRTSGAAAALDLLARVERVLTNARIPKTHRHWAELATRRAFALAGQGQYPEAARASALARQLASRGKWRDLEAQAAATAGQVAMRLGAVAEAEQHWLVAAECLGGDSDVICTIRAWHRLRRLARERADMAVVAECTAQVRRALQRATDERERAAGEAALAEAALLEGELEEAEDLAQAAAQATAKLHDLPGEAKARSLLAELAERRAELEAAREQWSKVIDLLESLGNTALATLARCRLGLLECRAKDYTAARLTVEVALAEGEPVIPWTRAAVHGVLAAAAAGSSRWDRFDQHLQVCELTYPSVLDRHPGYAEVMVLAGDLALKRLQRERAVRAWTLAEVRLTRLGHADAAPLRRKIATLGASP
jgi:tetratricopeptide (TPR) repeat protein